MNKIKKLFLAVAAIAIITPSIALAAWRNPLSWFNHWGMGRVDFPQATVEKNTNSGVKPTATVKPAAVPTPTKAPTLPIQKETPIGKTSAPAVKTPTVLPTKLNNNNPKTGKVAGWDIFKSSTEQPKVIETDIFGATKKVIQFSATQPGQSGIEKQITIPPNADLLQFKYVFTKGGDGDWVTVHFDGELLWSFRGDINAGLAEAVGKPFIVDTANIVQVRSLKGRTGLLQIVLHQDGPKPAEMLLADLGFETK